MQKELFQKLAESLANKYTQQELAEKLVQRKDKRVSNLIASAYNKKISSKASKETGYITEKQMDVFEKQAIDYFKLKEKVIGPNSWIYNILEQSGDIKEKDKSWNKFLNAIEFTSLDDPQTLDRIFIYACEESKKRLK